MEKEFLTLISFLFQNPIEYYDPLKIILLLFVLIIASFTDLKSREVPDWINFSLITTGFITNITLSILHNNSFYILNSLLGFLFYYIIASLFFYTGQWGGGDAKLLLAIGALLGFFYKNYYLDFKNLFAIQYLILTIIAGGIYSIIYILFLIIKNIKNIKKEIKKHRKQKKGIKKDRKKKEKKLQLIIFILFTIIIISLITQYIYNSTNIQTTILFLTILLFSGILYFNKKYYDIIEKTIFIKKTSLEKLVEGDWIIEDIKLDGRTIIKKTEIGLTKKDIEKIKKYYKKNKIKHVYIKEGLPFVPSFLIAFILMLFL